MDRKKALASAEAFLPKDPGVIEIIKMCDLYPANDGWRKWTDHLGNFIQIHNNKKVVSFVNNPTNPDERIITDIFYKSPPEKLFNMSQWAFISFGRDNNDIFNICFIWLLGADDRLRLLSYSDGEWLSNSPPLICGIDNLKSILKFKNIDDYSKADILNIKGPVAAKITKSWATKWSPSQDLINDLHEFSNELGSIIEEKLC